MAVKFQLESLDHKGNTEVEVRPANCVTGSMKVEGCIIIAKKWRYSQRYHWLVEDQSILLVSW